MQRNMDVIQESEVHQTGRFRLVGIGMLLTTGASLIGVGLYSLGVVAYQLVITGQLVRSVGIGLALWYFGSLVAQPFACFFGALFGLASGSKVLRRSRDPILSLSTVMAVVLAGLVYLLSSTINLCTEAPYECMTVPWKTVAYEMTTNLSHIPQMAWAILIAILCGRLIGKQALAWM